MKPSLFPLLLLLLNFFAVGAEPAPLITTLGEHALSPGLKLRVEEHGNDPLGFTISRKWAEGTVSESGYSLHAAPGEPFVFYWEPEQRRLWVASANVFGTVEIRDKPGKPGEPNESVSNANLNLTKKVSPELAAKMPAEFRAAAGKWFVITDAKK